MKSFVFIDNDNGESSQEDIEDIQYIFDNLNIPSEYYEDITAYSNLSYMDINEVTSILFNKDNIICSYSQYTISHYGSFNQLFTYLKAAGKYNTSNQIYIDCSGKLLKVIEDTVPNIISDKDMVINAINNNYILTYSKKDNAIFRISINNDTTYVNSFPIPELITLINT